jgi:beta-lactamase regulating signal transducer with metallopeptidase domain
MSDTSVLGGAVVQALGWTLVHFLWQGALLAALLVAVREAVARRSASARYALSAGTLALMGVVPVATFVSLLTRAATPEGGAMAAVAPTTANGRAETLAGLAASSSGLDPATLMPFLVAAWGLGVLALSVRMIGGWTVARRLARSGRPLSLDGLERSLARLCARMRIGRPVRLLESARVEIPTVVGWLRPVILFPAATLAGLTPAQLEVVLAHELAHVRRMDYLVNLLQTAVETLFFYHPAVWWVSGRLRVEREHCCDDAAVAACGDAVAYARALADLEGLRLTDGGLALAADGGSLLDRIGRLVGRPAAPSRRGARAVGAVAALAIVGGALAGPRWMESGAQAQAAETAAQAPAEPAQETPPAAEQGTAAPAPPRASRPPAGDGTWTIEQVLELARAGVTPEYLDEMEAAGFRDLTWQQLVDLRSNGVDAAYIKGMAAEGLTGLGPEQLQELRSNDVTPEYVRGLREQGLPRLDPGQLTELRSNDVTPQYVRELKALGYGSLSPDTLKELRSQDVTPQYVRGLKELGYPGLTTEQLTELRSHDVTPGYIRELKDAGYTGLSADELISLRSEGVSADLLRRLRRDRRPAR